jgi:anti-sigma regulatory factor (Ser/Thr protein kinase)
MSAAATPAARRPGPPFRHEALLYAGEREFLAGVLPFIRAALEARAPILVAVSAAKIDLLRAELDGDHGEVLFADMGELGVNPARIIPAWRDFVGAHSTSPSTWGIGEPIWAGRSPAELVEAQRHESLLNLAFADTAGFRLLCPYDTNALDPAVIEEARRSHAVVVEDGVGRDSVACRSLEEIAAPFAEPLPEPPGRLYEFTFQAHTLHALRRFVTRHAASAGMSAELAQQLVLAVNEVASNSVLHAGGWGVLRAWREGDALVCEIRDGGRIENPLVGRERARPGQVGGLGLWLANHLCELVQIRSLATGNVVRLHMRCS